MVNARAAGIVAGLDDAVRLLRAGDIKIASECFERAGERLHALAGACRRVATSNGEANAVAGRR
jgi:hypothetical protein